MGHDMIKGPRPISLHFANSQTIWDEAGIGLNSLDMDIWHADVKDRVSALKKAVEQCENQQAVNGAILRKVIERKDAFVKGINAYIMRPYQRPESQSVVSKRIGCSTLHDYGGDGTPVLMVPSLVNPYYILDLMPGRSFAGFLKANGYRPFLLDWGNPEETEAGYGLGTYIENRLEPMLQHVAAIAGQAAPVVGYCMGGTLCAAMVARYKSLISKLVLLAAPWNFDTEKPFAGRQSAVDMLDMVKALPLGADVGVDMLQTFFTNVDPTLSDRKFRAYQAGKYQGEDADFFSAMEIWANNGPALARQVAIECLGGWYRDNAPYLGQWIVGGSFVDPQDIQCPVLVAAPKSDRLVPQESAFAILERLTVADKHEPPSGHIGMVVGDRAKAGLWQPVLSWLNE